jgi:hypothetical protein
MFRHHVRSASVVICCLLLGSPLLADTIDNSTVSILDFYEAFPGYDVDFAIDTGPDAILSDYASRGGSVDTFIEFDLGQTYTLSEIIFTDRVTSGGPNHVWFGGLFDYVFTFNYILSVDSDFTNGDGRVDDIVIEVDAEEPGGIVPDESEIELLQTSTMISNVSARYVRWEIVDTRGQNPGANNFEFIAAGGGLPGDFNLNGDLDAGDLDLLAAQQQAGAPDLSFDLNSDGSVDFSDRELWVSSPNYAYTWMGDADLSGEFDSSDLVSVLASGTYEADVTAGWSSGDFDGNGRTNSSDLVAALAGGGYEQGPRPPVAAVPEPAAGSLALGAGLLVLARRRCWGRGSDAARRLCAGH